MKDQLEKYGFDDWQVDILMKGKALNTIPGIYQLKNNQLYLKRHRDKSKTFIGIIKK